MGRLVEPSNDRQPVGLILRRNWYFLVMLAAGFTIAYPQHLSPWQACFGIALVGTGYFGILTRESIMQHRNPKSLGDPLVSAESETGPDGSRLDRG